MKGALVLTNIFGLGCQFVMFQSLRLRVSHTLQILVMFDVAGTCVIMTSPDHRVSLLFLVAYWSYIHGMA